MLRARHSSLFVVLVLACFPAAAAAKEINEIISGDTLSSPSAIAVDDSGNVYLTGDYSHNAFKITPGGVISEIIDNWGDRGGNGLGGPSGIAVEDSGDVYVTGNYSDNAFKITPEGVISEIIDNLGDRMGNGLSRPSGIVVDASGNAYVTLESGVTTSSRSRRTASSSRSSTQPATALAVSLTLRAASPWTTQATST